MWLWSRSWPSSESEEQVTAATYLRRWLSDENSEWRAVGGVRRGMLLGGLSRKKRKDSPRRCKCLLVPDKLDSEVRRI